MQQNATAAEAATRDPLGELTALPKPPISVGGEKGLGEKLANVSKVDRFAQPLPKASGAGGTWQLTWQQRCNTVNRETNFTKVCTKKKQSSLA